MSDGRSLRTCRAEVSSGDRELDDMGCKVVGWCVRRGFVEPDRALACFHWFQARLDDRAPAEEDRRAVWRRLRSSPDVFPQVFMVKPRLSGAYAMFLQPEVAAAH